MAASKFQSGFYGRFVAECDTLGCHPRLTFEVTTLQECLLLVSDQRLSDEISYNKPVLYAHLESREGILAAVVIEAFSEIGL